MESEEQASYPPEVESRTPRMQLRENAQRCNLPEDALRPACIPEPILLQRHEVDLGGGDTSSILQSPNDEQKASDLRSGVLTDNHRNALRALLTLGPAGAPIPTATPAVRAATAACSCTTRRAPDGLGQPLPRCGSLLRPRRATRAARARSP